MNIRKELSNKLKRELVEIAKRLGLKGISKLNKEGLIKAIEKAMRQQRAETEKRTNVRKRRGVKEVKAQEKGKEEVKKKEEKREEVIEKKEKVEKPMPPAPDEEKRSWWAEVTASKYTAYTPPKEELQAVDSSLVELPESYDEDRIVLLPRDPAWAFCYWSVSGKTFDMIRERGGEKFKLEIFYKDTGELAGEYYPEFYVKNWYIPIPEPAKLYFVRLGAVTSSGEYILLMESNVIKIPPASPSMITEERFITIPFDEDLRKLFPKKYKEVLREFEEEYGVAVYHKPEEKIREKLPKEEGYREMVFLRGSPMPWSPGVWSISHRPGWSLYREVTPFKEADKFDFQAEVELIVYGKVEQGGKVFIAGEPISVREDGSFEARMAFPVGKYDLPVLGVSANKKHKKEIIFRLERG